MTRIVAGAARGRRLAVPPGARTRPTSDRAREGLFSTVESLAGPLRGARFADLYAGSGAVGLEALSRGAAAVLFVEADARAVRTLRENVAAAGLPGGKVVAGRVRSVVAEPPHGDPYDVVFLDPPYAEPDRAVLAVLDALAGNAWLSGDALVAVERATRAGEFPWPQGWAPLRSRRYGEGTLWYGRPAPQGGHLG